MVVMHYLVLEEGLRAGVLSREFWFVWVLHRGD